MNPDELIVDSFAGGGGASLGLTMALGRSPDIAINHSRKAIAMHAAIHPETHHYCEDVWEVDPREATRGRPVGVAWFSPDCCHFSRAKGSQPVKKHIRGLASVVIKWVRDVRPRIIMLENVREFEDWGPLLPILKADGTPELFPDGSPKMRPDPDRAGETFADWVRILRNHGYRVEWRPLNAADYGAPTHRRRLFLVARCDGLPIVWPEPSHADPAKIGKGLFDQHLLPYRTAAECVDWTLPCHSIFLTKAEARAQGLRCIRPLAENTMKRIAMGLKRFVLDNPRPFLVTVNHGGDHFRGRSIDEPVGTLTGKNGYGVVSPFFTAQFGERQGQAPRAHRADEPLPTITARAGGGFPLVTPFLSAYYGEGNDPGPRGNHLDEPLRTQTASNRFALVSAFLAKHYGGVTGHELDRPIGTITSVDHHSVIAATLIKNNHGDKQAFALDEPLRTVLAGGKHHALTFAFLTKFYGRSTGHLADEPAHTIPSNDRLGLITVEGQDFAIVDIGLRMLGPRELYRCQGFPETYIIDPIVDGKPLSLGDQVEMCGNSVCPQVAAAIARANVGVMSHKETIGA